MTSAVDSHKKILATFFRVHLGKINVQVANGIVFKLFLWCGLPVFAQRQAAHAVALKTAVQGRAREVRDGLLQGIQTVIERQQRVLAKGHSNSLFFDREYRRSGLRPHRGIGRRGAFTPLGHRLRVNTVALS